MALHTSDSRLGRGGSLGGINPSTGSSPAPEPLTVTNAEKLALTGISIGQRVNITDALTMSGAGSSEVNGLHTKRGTNDSKDYYNLVGQPSDPLASAASWVVNEWEILASGGGVLYMSGDDVSQPWLAAFDTGDGDSPVPTITHPAVQQYTGTDPSSEANWEII